MGKTLKKLFFITISLLVCIGCNPTPKKESLTIEYIAHASFILSNDTTSILIDPFKSRHWIGYSFPENIIADATFITHPHYDHDGGRFLGENPYWEAITKIYETAGTYQVGEFKVTGTKGKHCDPYGKEFGQKNIIWKIDVAGMRLVHLGDNGPLTEANYKALGKTDVLFIPIDDKYHILKHNEIQEIISRLEPRFIIPMHYRVSYLEDEDKPNDLGDITAYLEGQQNVIRTDSNRMVLTKDELPETPTYLHLRTHPDLKK